MHDSAQEARMRQAAPPDPVATAQAKVTAAIRDILQTEQQHGVITVTLKAGVGGIHVEVVATTTQRY